LFVHVASVEASDNGLCDVGKDTEDRDEGTKDMSKRYEASGGD
jgi:hypothetical protein